MKFPFSLLLVAVLAISGCKPATGPTPPLAPGYSNQADQTMGQTLAAAHAFYSQIQRDTSVGTFVPSQAEKVALNDLAIAINIAQTAYVAFHNGQGTQAAAQTAIDQVVVKQTTVQGLMPAGGN